MVAIGSVLQSSFLSAETFVFIAQKGRNGLFFGQGSVCFGCPRIVEGVLVDAFAFGRQLSEIAVDVVEQCFGVLRNGQGVPLKGSVAAGRIAGFAHDLPMGMIGAGKIHHIGAAGAVVLRTEGGDTLM